MEIHEMARNARRAFFDLSSSSLEKRNKALLLMADKLEKSKEIVFKANEADLAEAKDNRLAAPLLQRLKFDRAKMSQVQLGLRSLESLKDPVGETVFCHEISESLKLYRVTCPIGVIGIIFESRPDALVQIASLAVKSGNSALLKGGREALRTNQALIAVLQEALKEADLPKDACQLMETREDVSAMLKEDELIDLIIPRGSNEFVRYIMNNSQIPVLGHADGVCHVYVDSEADLETAWKVALDSKVQNLSVCNAEETLLVHEKTAKLFLPKFAELLRQNHVEIRGDQATQSIIDCNAAQEEDWKTEYLDAILSIKVVRSMQEAVEHINHYGSHHTDCIITENRQTAAEFMNRVDSAGVYLNVSTRFADGFVYGLGAEVGIATGKLHARGPMGLDGLTTYKYKLIGHGQTMAEMKSGLLHYTHRVLDEKCPL